VAADLTPADLAEGGGLLQALHAVAERETTPSLTVRVHCEGSPPDPLPAPVESALPRIAQGASRLRNPRPTLTPREQEILAHLSRGLANHAIARALYISEATVKTHLRRIYDKLGVDTRAGAVAVAKEQRLLP
jgi:DNA-binding NarL/FixJ family response regulator